MKLGDIANVLARPKWLQGRVEWWDIIMGRSPVPLRRGSWLFNVHVADEQYTPLVVCRVGPRHDRDKDLYDALFGNPTPAANNVLDGMAIGGADAEDLTIIRKYPIYRAADD